MKSIEPAYTVLPQEDQKLLDKCEAVIERHIVKFMEVGKALVTIRDKKLYRMKYGTFEQYCQARWGWTRQHAYRLLDATRVLAELEAHDPKMSPIGDILPEIETQVRPLVEKLKDPDDRREAWKIAVEKSNGEQPTARQVKEAVALVKGEAQPSAPRIEPRFVSIGADLEKAAERIVSFYTPAELRSLIALIAKKGNLAL